MKPDARPKFCKARPVPYAFQEAVEAEYNRLESEGIVKRVEFSEWATPMVHVPKQMETHVLMMIMLLLSTPSFTSLSIQFLFRRICSWNCGVDNFGIASSPALYQRTMDIILQGLEHVASIQDDILITGKDDDEHIKNLEGALSCLDQYSLRLQVSKCKFMQKSVTYMGCVISSSRISPTEEKVEAIKQAPRLENLTQLRAFFGMINYHGKFIRYNNNNKIFI